MFASARPRTSLYLLLVICASSALAGENLNTLVRTALENNAGLRASRAQLAAEEAGADQASAQWWPTLSATGGAFHNRGRREVGGPPDAYRYNKLEASINLRQPILRKDLLDQVLVSEAKVGAIAHRNDAARNQLALRVASAYIDYLYLDDQTRLIAAQKRAVAQQLANVERSAAAGRNTRIDVDEARARLDLVVAQELDATSQRQNAVKTIEALTGQPVREISPAGSAKLKLTLPQPGTIAAWIALAENTNPDLKALHAQSEVANRDVERTKAGHWPTLDLVSSASRTRNESPTSLETTATNLTVGVQLNIPLFSGGQVDAATRQALARRDQSTEQTEELRQTLSTEVTREFNGVEQGIQRIRALERATESARQTVESNRRGFAAGQRTTLDILQAEQQVFVAERDLAQARYRYLLSLLRLKSLGGQLTGGDFAEIAHQLLAGAPGAPSP